LTLASIGRQKVINYISTLSIFKAEGNNRSQSASESTPIDHERHLSSSGYIASKWVSEKIFITANEWGIPCNIFRLGLVWADSREGRYDDLQREYRVFKSSLLSGFGIGSYRHELPPTPVDYAARAIVVLAGRSTSGDKIFHISSPPQTTSGLFEWSNEVADTSLKIVSYYEWISRIKRLHYGGCSLPVVPLIEYAFSMDERTFNERHEGVASARTQFDCAWTDGELERAGIKLPALDERMLRAFLGDLCSRDEELRSWSAGKRSEAIETIYGKRSFG